MQCPQCGAEAENGQWFCKDCGTRLTPAADSSTEVVAEEPLEVKPVEEAPVKTEKAKEEEGISFTATEDTTETEGEEDE